VWAFVAALGLLIESDEAVAKRRALSENNFLRMLSPVNSKGRLKREGELRRSTVTEIILGIRSLTFFRGRRILKAWPAHSRAATARWRSVRWWSYGSPSNTYNHA
jgi:hypothetical protein